MNIKPLYFRHFLLKSVNNLVIEAMDQGDGAYYDLIVPQERRLEVPQMLTNKDSFAVSIMQGKAMYHEFDASKCIYIVNPYIRGEQKRCLVYDFTDQDFVIRSLIEKFGLVDVKYTRTLRSVMFEDERRTQFAFAIVKKTELETTNASHRQLSISTTV